MESGFAAAYYRRTCEFNNLAKIREKGNFNFMREKPVNCVGKKGRSGRKSHREEMHKIMAIEQAWKRVNEDMSKFDVKEVALPVALKDMTQKSELSGTVNIAQITGMKIIQDNGNSIQNQDTATDTSSEVLD